MIHSLNACTKMTIDDRTVPLNTSHLRILLTSNNDDDQNQREVTFAK